MNALRLAIYFLQVPKFFISLILFPLILSIGFVLLQTFVTLMFVKKLESEGKAVTTQMLQAKDKSIIRKILYDKSEPLPPPIICRWNKKLLNNGDAIEVHPSKECSPDRLDAAIHVSNPLSYDPREYVNLLSGSFLRIHICEKDCRPDIVIAPNTKGTRTEIYSMWAFALLHESRLAAATNKDFVDQLNQVHAVQGLVGESYLFTKGLRGAVNIKNILYSMAIVMNFALLIIVALWLALKAHRKILDYFAHSGALLPLVAATGKGTFYSALWILTFIRVGAFIIAAIPIGIYSLLDSIPEDIGPIFTEVDTSELLLWGIAISISMGFATLIASIADLKHRHSALSFTYKFLPLIFSGIGAFVWGLTFIIEGPFISTIRDTITSLPLFGMAPILIAPILKPKVGLFVIHTLLTTLLLALAARLNTRWFAAHLEEL